MKSNNISLAAHPAPFEGITAEDIRSFFQDQTISPKVAPFQGLTSEDIEQMFADAIAAPCFASSTSGDE